MIIYIKVRQHFTIFGQELLQYHTLLQPSPNNENKNKSQQHPSIRNRLVDNMPATYLLQH